MEILSKSEILDSLNSDEDESIYIDPLLDRKQVSGVTVDFRLGYDFYVSILTRKPYISLSNEWDLFPRSINSYFQETRREIGEKFILYPNQVVLTTTLEYLSLPSNVYLDMLSRSSYTRLGMHINTMIQPGFRGCAPLELFNHGNNAIELVVGSRICQARFFKSRENNNYITSDIKRKYYGDVRPAVSKADMDTDFCLLSKISQL